MNTVGHAEDRSVQGGVVLQEEHRLNCSQCEVLVAQKQLSHLQGLAVVPVQELQQVAPVVETVEFVGPLKEMGPAVADSPAVTLDFEPEASAAAAAAAAAAFVRTSVAAFVAVVLIVELSLEASHNQRRGSSSKMISKRPWSGSM